MKKIVALVLAMVMVLGLATTAFAAKMGYDNLDNAKADAGWDYNVEMDDAEDAKDETFATYEIEAVAKKDDAVMWWTTQTDVEKGDDFDIEGTYVKIANPAFATLVMVDGKVITYFLDVTDVEFTWDAKATKVTLPGYPADGGDRACNTLYNIIGAPGTFYWDAAEEVLYVASKGEDYDAVLNVDGVAVLARVAYEQDELLEDGSAAPYNDYIYNGHSLIVNWADRTYTNSVVPTKVYCEFCKAEFAFVYGYEEDALAAYGAGNYMCLNEVTNPRLPDVWIELIVPVNYPAAPAVVPSTPADKDDAVTSPKTFDAGIAMYVGMSVMAAAGSAVVLKKKD